jgi:hypothetical protein
VIKALEGSGVKGREYGSSESTARPLQPGEWDQLARLLPAGAIGNSADSVAGGESVEPLSTPERLVESITGSAFGVCDNTLAALDPWTLDQCRAGRDVPGVTVTGHADDTCAATATTEATATTRGSSLDDELKRLAEQHLSDSGDTVLGRWPGYVDKANARGASYFDIGTEWDRLVSEGIDPWALNEHFLDVISDRGDRVLLSVPKQKIPDGGYLSREVQHLVNQRGYTWMNQWSLQRTC